MVKQQKPADLRKTREGLGMSQAEFAVAFHLSRRTVEKWEQGETKPEGPARVLLWLICNAPKTILKLLKGAE